MGDGEVLTESSKSALAVEQTAVQRQFFEVASFPCVISCTIPAQFNIIK